LLFLAVGDVACLLVIYFLLRQGASFRDVLESGAVNVAPTLLAGLGMTGIVCAGAIDLSIGAIIAVAGTVFGILVHHGAPPAAAYAGCMATAGVLSALNGLVVRVARIPAIIWTLAALAIYRGVALIAADLWIPSFSGNISITSDAYHGPGKFHAIAILIAATSCALLWEACAMTPRLWLARGNSEEACKLQGLDPARILVGAFAVGGLFLGLGALIQATQVQAIEPARLALGFELPVIGAVVLGGTNIFGGEGCYLGTALGAFFLYFVEQILVYAGVNVYWREVLSGTAIIAVIGIDCFLHRGRKLLEELQ
jgi:ribose/xylose/arabinose/galactoside ABC-type transport system permease subunit